MSKHSFPNFLRCPLQSSPDGQVGQSAHSGGSAIREQYLEIHQRLQNLSRQPSSENTLLAYEGHVRGGTVGCNAVAPWYRLPVGVLELTREISLRELLQEPARTTKRILKVRVAQIHRR